MTRKFVKRSIFLEKTKTKTNKKKELWDNILHITIHNIGISDKGERERSQNVFDEIRAETSLNLKETGIQI